MCYTKASLTESFNKKLYNEINNNVVGYNTSIAIDNDNNNILDIDSVSSNRLIDHYTAIQKQINKFARNRVKEEDILFNQKKLNRITNRETNYQKYCFNRDIITPI